jgi:cytochrome P450
MTAMSSPAQAASRVRFDPFDPETRACPYESYRRLRQAAPVWLHPEAGIWFVSGHREAAAVLRDPRFSVVHDRPLRRGARELPVTMLTCDPPEHTRLRDAVAEQLAGRRVARLADGVRATTAARVGGWRGRGRVDAIGELAVPVAADALARLLGVPAGEVDRFGRWALEVAPHLDPLDPPGPGTRASVALGELLDWFADLLAERVGTPTDDVLGALVQAYDEHALSAEEVRNTCGLLVIGGFEPLVDLIGTTLWLVLREGSEAVLQAARSGDGGIVAESLRVESPIHFAARVAVEDVALGDRTVKAGDRVVVLLGAGNRDPGRFEDPDRFDPGRRPNPHLAFGAGAHACLGAAFARLVARVAVSAAVQGAPAMRLAGGPTWRDTYVPRGLAELPIDAWS